MVKPKTKKPQNSSLKEFFNKHMTYSVMTLGIFVIILYSLFNLLMYGPTGHTILIFILKVILVVVVLFIIKQLLGRFDNKKIYNLRDLKWD